MAKLISIITASIHKEKLCGLFDNLESTANNMDSFEVLVKVDDDHQEMIDYMETERRRRSFLIRYIATPKLDGYWSIYIALNDLLKIASDETYFVWIPNDEIRFATQNWDNIVHRYRGLFPDDVFYLRVSGNRHRKCSLVDCCPSGEHLGFFTKNWLHLTEGFGRGAADTGMELIYYYLKNKCGQIRSVPIDDIEFVNLEKTVSAGYGLSKKEWEQKLRRINAFYAKLLSIGSQENIYRLAQRLNAYIWAREKGLSYFQIRDDKSAKQILIKDNSQLNALNSFDYKLSITDWLNSIVDSINRDQKYLSWPPVLANLIRVRRKLAENWINISPMQITKAYFDDLEKAHTILCDIFKNRVGFQNELLGLTLAGKGLVDEIVEYISCDFYAPSESAFSDELFVNLSSGISEPLATQYSLAATLYGYIPQKAMTCEGIKTKSLQLREQIGNMKATASGQIAGLYKNQQAIY
jgi:hypothetical protein